MPRSWNNRRERQYRRILASNLKKGIPKKRAKQIAARTVNKQRRLAGETKKG